ncbi:MAG: hypothetical protein WBR56_11765, partial [Sedimenticolaceae bacterium]
PEVSRQSSAAAIMGRTRVRHIPDSSLLLFLAYKSLIHCDFDRPALKVKRYAIELQRMNRSVVLAGTFLGDGTSRSSGKQKSWNR